MLFAAVALLLGVIWLARRSRQIGAELARSQADRAALRVANRRLETEIDDRRTAERRLERAQRDLARASKLAALGQLAASVTHELGQPITAMRTYLSAAEISGDASPALPRIDALVTRMQRLTNELRFFSRPGPEAFEPVDLRQALDASLELLAGNLASSGARLMRKDPQGPVIVVGNRLRLEQVVVNILRNALDAMSDAERRELTLHLSAGNGQAVLSVRDTGHGLGDIALDRLQEPFYSTRASGEGMGLGLAISVEIIREHDGWLEAENAPPAGAVFSVHLPLARKEDLE